MHLRAQKFQLDVVVNFGTFQSSCEHSECCQMVFIFVIFEAIWIIYQECSKRWFRWRYVNRLTLRFSRKAEIVTNGLLKMCPRLEPQQHFEAACCSGITILAVARVSCMSVCKMRPRLEPQHCARACSRPPHKHSEISSRQLLQAPKG